MLALSTCANHPQVACTSAYVKRRFLKDWNIEDLDAYLKGNYTELVTFKGVHDLGNDENGLPSAALHVTIDKVNVNMPLFDPDLQHAQPENEQVCFISLASYMIHVH